MPTGPGEEERRLRIVISVQITDAEGKTRTERALIDSGAEGDCIKQALAVECKWTPQKDEIGLATLDGKEVITYGNHDIPLTATDSEGTTKTHRHSFVACDFDIPGVSIILGFPWLNKVDPAISFRAGTWRYPFDKSQVNFLSAKRFVKQT